MEFQNKISFREKDYMYSAQTLDPPKLKLHLHKYYEFLYFLGGDANYMVEDTTYEANAGDIFLTRPNELHTLVFQSNEKYSRQFIQISSTLLADIDIDLLYYINHRPFGQDNKIPASFVNENNLGEYFDKVRYYVLNRLPESDLMIKTYIIQLLVNVNNILHSHSNESTLYKPKNPRIELITTYIEENIASDITLEKLSELFFINKYYMCHMFKEETGMTIKEFINTRRIAKAKNLLQKGHNITDLSFACGFNDYSTFYKTFKNFTGKSPTQFLK